MTYVLKVSPQNKVILFLMSLDRKLGWGAGSPYSCLTLCGLALWSLRVLLCSSLTLAGYAFLLGTMACAAYVTYGVCTNMFLPPADTSTWGVAYAMSLFFGTCIGWVVFLVWVVPTVFWTVRRWTKALWRKLEASTFCVSIDFYTSTHSDVPKRRGEYE